MLSEPCVPVLSVAVKHRDQPDSVNRGRRLLRLLENQHDAAPGAPFSIVGTPQSSGLLVCLGRNNILVTYVRNAFFR